MVFSTVTFLFLFLPLVLVSYFIVKNRIYRNIVLLVASLLFYGWGEPKAIIMMLLATMIAFVGGLLIDKYDKD